MDDCRDLCEFVTKGTGFLTGDRVSRQTLVNHYQQGGITWEIWIVRC